MRVRQSITNGKRNKRTTTTTTLAKQVGSSGKRTRNFKGDRIMAKIVQTLTRASREYDADVSMSMVRDLDGVINKLNSTYQQDLKDEINAESWFIE